MTAALPLETIGADGRRVHIVQGQFNVTGDPGDVLTTVLGSCIAACIRDPVAQVGGMNHFLLPGEAGSDGLRYGVNAMELLLNGILQKGGRRERLEAKLFGGARLFDGLSDIGAQNAAFAQRFLREEQIALVGGSTGGRFARRIQFWPCSGRSRQLSIAALEALPQEAPAPAITPDEGGVELF